MENSPFRWLRVNPQSQIPLALQISQQIRLILASEQLPQDHKLPSLRELAMRLGISFHTVKAAYQQLEQEGLLSTRQGVGTVVTNADLSSVKRHTASVPTHSIGVILPSFTEFFSPIIRGIQMAAQGNPDLFFICDAQEEPARVDRYLDQLVARGVDGILLISRELEDFEKIKRIKANPEAFPPIVAVDIPGYPAPTVNFELAEGMQQAAAHLMGHGHQRVGIITPPQRWSNVAECLRGIQLAFEESGLDFQDELITEVENYRPSSGAQAAQRLLRLRKPPTAILVLGDLLATGVLKQAENFGIKVPEDLALIAFNDPIFFEMVDPPITTVRVPAYDLGKEAYKVLRKAIVREVKLPKHVTLQTELVVRRSCGCDFPQ